MRNFILMLIIAATVSAFSVDTVTNFPTQMYGGSVYSASYHVNGDAIYPVYAFVDAPEDFIVTGCTQYEQWVCSISSSDFNITVRLPSNITPDNYTISTVFSANYTVPDAPVTYSGGYSGGSGGGSSSGYISTNKTKDEILKNASDAIIAGEALLNRSKPIVPVIENKTPEYTTWNPTSLPDAYILSLNKTFNAPLLASMTVTSDNPWIFWIGLILIVVFLIVYYWFMREKPKPVEIKEGVENV
jgi:hypothetical protein